MQAVLFVAVKKEYLMQKIFAFIFALALYTVLQTQAFAQVENTKNEPTVKPQVVEQVRLLVKDITEHKNDIKALDRQIKYTKSEVEIQQLEKERKQLQAKLEKQYLSLEQIATGAADLSLFQQASEDNFSWQAELKEVFKPLLFELKKLSERPRQIEQLRSEQSSLITQIEAAKLATKEINTLSNAMEAGQTKEALTQLLKEWQTRQEDLKSRAQLVEFQLNEKLDNNQSRSTAIVDALKGFMTGRGANLLFSLLAFLSTFILLRWLSHSLERVISKGRDAERRFFARLVHVVFQVLTVVISLLALMATLYALSDWLILTLLIIMLVGFAFALRNSLPRYMEEARLLLNLGPVREGERVIYNGLPWRVSRLNIYSDLVNPLLTGGRLRLPLSIMLTLVSRRWSRTEPWFPCKPNDYLVMSDNTYGQVALQTPEIVQLNVLGGAKRTYPTNDFLAATPRNLSEGFGLFLSFGLDYAMQASITQSAPATLEDGLKKAIEKSEYKELVNELRVEFEEAGASSLNLMIIAIFDGEAAKHYHVLKRYLQRITVEACNEHNWNIPFNQLTVHMNDQANSDENEIQS